MTAIRRELAAQEAVSGTVRCQFASASAALSGTGSVLRRMRAKCCQFAEPLVVQSELAAQEAVSGTVRCQFASAGTVGAGVAA